MNFVFLLFIFLVPLSNCGKILQIEPNKLTLLATSTDYYDYFWLDGNSLSKTGYIYLYFEDNNFNLYSNELQVCFDNVHPNNMVSCSFKTKTPNYSLTTGSKNIYLYLFNYDISYGKYIVAKYSGKDKTGKIYVEASESDVHKLVTAVLSTVAIVFIVIGSIIVGTIILIILCCCCICRRRTKVQVVGYTQPYVINNSATYPLTPSVN